MRYNLVFTYNHYLAIPDTRGEIHPHTPLFNINADTLSGWKYHPTHKLFYIDIRDTAVKRDITTKLNLDNTSAIGGVRMHTSWIEDITFIYCVPETHPGFNLGIAFGLAKLYVKGYTQKSSNHVVPLLPDTFVNDI